MVQFLKSEDESAIFCPDSVKSKVVVSKLMFKNEALLSFESDNDQ